MSFAASVSGRECDTDRLRALRWLRALRVHPDDPPCSSGIRAFLLAEKELDYVPTRIDQSIAYQGSPHGRNSIAGKSSDAFE